jgi:hypothetical protein
MDFRLEDMIEVKTADDSGYTLVEGQSDGQQASEDLRYQCVRCKKQYERLDHVKRHLKSRK